MRGGSDETERGRLADAIARETEAVWGQLAGGTATVHAPKWEPATAERLLDYLDVLGLWRQKTSLVATADPREIVSRHIVDSLAVLPFLAPGERIADLGSGAGLPGLVLAIAAPELRLLLVEPRRKRATFLREAIRATGAGNAQVADCRVEDLDASACAGLDAVVSRAFGPLESYLAAAESVATRIAPRTLRVLAMKGPRGAAEAETVAARFGRPECISYNLIDATPRQVLIYPKFLPRFPHRLDSTEG